MRVAPYLLAPTLWLVSASALAQSQFDNSNRKAATPLVAGAKSITGVVAPKLTKDVVPTYPEVPVAERRHVDVRLQLTVDAAGGVGTIIVLEAPSEVFAAEAKRVAALLEFTPAQKDGKPVAVRIQYLCSFEPEPQPAEPPPTATEAPQTGAAFNGTSGQAESEADEPLEVTVEGRLNSFDQLQQSADQVTVVRLEEVRRRATDMGEVLARTPGVVVRRSGGLGSEARLSLGGLYDDAVQVFVDGVPISLSGMPTNVSLVPVNIVRHMEVYHGVVPLRLSADALGGAINIATDTSYENQASLSYQVGSFGVHRATGMAQSRNDETGFVSRVTGYFDYAKNNFDIDVEVPDARGRLSAARVQRFHDAYRAYAYTAEVGYVEKPWAERLVLKGFYGRSLKEYQHNIVMTVPYGEVTYGDRSVGAQLLYEQPFSNTISLQAVAVVAHRSYDFSDESQWVYDWFGNQVGERRVAGEIEAKPRNQTLWVNSVFGRALASWTPSPNHAIRLTTSPTFSTQTGDERRQFDPDARDPLTALANMFRLVSGLGHEWHALPYAGKRKPKFSEDFALESIFSIKHYYYSTAAEQPQAGNVFRRKDIARALWGVNEGIRYGFTRWLFAKGSYEYATRLPSPQEVFGDGGFIQSNVDLLPETSHNLNLGLLVDAKGTPAGSWLASVSGIRRDTRDQIVLLGNDRFFTYQNVYNTVLHGIQGSFDWISRHRMFQLNVGGEYLDPRNDSDKGAFAGFKGDRIPNRPNLMGSWGARFTLHDLWMDGELEAFYQGRFTEGFFRGWESQGLRQYKQKVDSQTSHDAGLIYQWSMHSGRLSTGVEVQNILDEKLFDNYGQQRPGRAYCAKVVADFY